MSRDRSSPDSASTGEAPPKHREDSAHAARCFCGSLLARYVPGGVELKCRRCKRTLIIEVEGQPITRHGTTP